MKNYQCLCCGYYTYSVSANEDCGLFVLFASEEMTLLLFQMITQATLIME